MKTGHFRSNNHCSLVLWLLGGLGVMLPVTGRTESAISYRLGTFGFGLDYDVKLREQVTLRLGYNGYFMTRDVDRDGMRYKAALQVNAFSVLVDWHQSGSPWRFTTGLTQTGPELRADGKPNANTVIINGQTYTSDQLGKIDVSIKSSHSLAPYIGMGWGRSVGSEDQFAFLFDLGALYTGVPKSHVTADCGTMPSNASCDQLIADIRAEAAEEEYKHRHLTWWPVLSIGFAMRWH